MKAELNIILEKIKEYDDILIFGHIRPDGDCLGSQFGLYDIIKTTWPKKHAHVVGQSSDYVAFLGQPESVPEYVYKNALGIVVDTGSPDRISDPRYKLCRELIKIDHHHPVGSYGDFVWVEVYWPSAAQMIGYFYKMFDNELKISPKGAEAIYTGIVTDTGGFRYRGVDNLTHNIAGLMLSKGADVEIINQSLSLVDENIVDLKGYVLSNMVKCDFGFLYFVITSEILETYNVSYEAAASMVGEMAGIKGYPVWALILEYPSEYRVRLRSMGTGPSIHKIAEEFGGGGHDNAAGFSIPNLESGIRDLKYAVKRLLEDWKPF